MAQLQIKDIPQEFLTALKIAAAQQGQTLKDFVLTSLKTATLPPVVVGGTRGAGSARSDSAPVLRPPVGSKEWNKLAAERKLSKGGY